MAKLLVNRDHIVVYKSRSIMHRYGVRVSYASKGGGLISKWEAHKWKHINGIHINTKWLNVWLLFRRTGA